MKAYHEVCEDIIKMLEELEDSLEDIHQEALLFETQAEAPGMESKPARLKQHFEVIKKPI